MDEKLREAIDALQKALPKGAAAMILWEKEPTPDMDNIGGEFVFPDGGMVDSVPCGMMEKIAVHFGINVSAGKNEMG